MADLGNPDSFTIKNAKIGGQVPIDVGWDNFAQPLINLNTYISCTSLEPVAQQVVKAYGLPFDSSGFTGGTLKDMDIKRMDAMTAIRYSLMEESFVGSTDRLIEAIVTAEGNIKFVEVGGGGAASLDDIYYSVQNGHYVDSPKGVMVNGGKPAPEIRPLEWSPIWVAEGSAGAPIYAARGMLENCMQNDWKSYATIVFNDPQLSSAFEDGIDNLYEITKENPWDEILGYAVAINLGKNGDNRTTVQYNSESEIPLMIAEAAEGICEMGNIQNMPEYDPNATDPRCWSGLSDQAVSYGDGVPVNIPSHFRYENIRGSIKDKFIDVTGVYIIGQEIDSLYARPIDNAAALLEMTEENSEVWLEINNIRRSSVKLEAGRHYAVAYQDLTGDSYPEVSIVFAQETRPHDKLTYGNGAGGGVEFKIYPFCQYYKNGQWPGGTGQATIFPYNRTKGMIVEEIWVTVRVETPSITVHHPDGANDRALSIAEELEWYVAPLVMRAPPAPIGYKGTGSSGPIDQVPSKRDNDPTTVQSFEDTPIEKAMDEMQGSGMTVTFSFLTGAGSDPVSVYANAELEAQQAAETLYNMMNADVTETVYTCGPYEASSLPELGQAGPSGGVINSIRHSYSDQGSYTISLTEGPALIGNLVQVDGGPAQKMAEDYGAKAYVTQALGDNIHFKVRIDGFGERWAVNTSHNIIRENDIVQCTVHNNPVEA